VPLKSRICFCSIPVVKLRDGKGLSNQQVETLHRELIQLTKKLVGEVNVTAFIY